MGERERRSDGEGSGLLIHFPPFLQWVEHQGWGAFGWRGRLAGSQHLEEMLLYLFLTLCLLSLASADVNTNGWLQLFRTKEPWLRRLCVYEDQHVGSAVG